MPEPAPDTDGHRSSRRPRDLDVDREAPVLVELSRTIDAPLPVVWRCHTDIDAWPSWQPDVSSARLDGAVEPGSTFEWQTHGLDITSTITQVVLNSRIVWAGPAEGIHGIHVWTFTPTDEGVVVHTTESWSGPPVEADPDGLRANLTVSLATWLDRLKEMCESRGTDRTAGSAGEQRDARHDDD
ncbi:SRPBCC family protein [Aeromicrobium chenweiae]|uniref:Shy6-polyketide cyclase n=1 Tax=Aeromicrobium chenweiae TaxID=2079793 RepID=A0A2S0WP57_9ACTN|nr:SRPBCC family protein [Aeromicrobium chenweiae]AWB93060.1 Shy6-polyketide cyclase [Aeromicrobium chenweiae]TGN34049.1 Shy6-polyketide cyclase [Aeromicrobium chenweiae]